MRTKAEITAKFKEINSMREELQQTTSENFLMKRISFPVTLTEQQFELLTITTFCLALEWALDRNGLLNQF